MLEKAVEIAAKAHAGQVDKGGKPYILHPLRVMMKYCDDGDVAAQICAVLHDVVEDTIITLEDLRAEGFTEEILAALDCMTKRDGESYNDFISRILTNELACKVKRGDLEDNMDLTRIKSPTSEDEERVKKYRDAANRIGDVLPDSFVVGRFHSRFPIDETVCATCRRWNGGFLGTDGKIHAKSDARNFCSKFRFETLAISGCDDWMAEIDEDVIIYDNLGHLFKK